MAVADLSMRRWLPVLLGLAMGLLTAAFILLLVNATEETSEPVDQMSRPTVDTATSGGPEASTTSALPEGFDTMILQVTDPDGTTREWCVWSAETTDQMSQGLQGVTELGEPVGLAFNHDEPVDLRFHMHNVQIPLSVAWFAGAGDFIDATDMVPCIEASRSNCPRYSSPRPYRLAVEVRRGELDGYGMVPGSSVRLLDEPCV